MKEDRVYLEHILRCIARIEEYTAEGRDKFFTSHLVQDGVVRNLQILAESSRRLSDHVKASHPGVGWKGLAGFRNVLVHDYLGVDLDYVYRAVEHDVPRLKIACQAALKGLEDQKEDQMAAGRILNAKTAHSQIMGAVVGGIGMALHEETVIDHRYGRFINHNFAEYHVPVNADIHDIDVIFVEEREAHLNPLGVKGVGETGTIASSQAYVNAVCDALGVDHIDMPITPEKVWRVLQTM